MSPKISRRQFLHGTVLAGAGAAFLAACAPPMATPAPTKAPEATTAPVATTAPEATAAPTTLTFATGSPWGSYNIFRPVYAYGYSSSQIPMLTHDRLAEWDHTNTLKPGLAEKWEVSADATKYTFYLRKNVKWQDGQPFTSKDVATTVKLILTKEANINPLNWISNLKGGQEFYDGKSTDLPGLQVKDDYTVTFELVKPYVAWHEFAITDLNILPDHIFKDVKPADIKEQYSEAWFKPELNLGTGPFKFVGAKMDEYVELARNDNYWRGKPKLQRILFKNLGKADTQFIALQKGELDAAGIGSDYLAQAKALTNVNLYTLDRPYIRVFVLHYEAPYLSDKRVRQALAYGIDRKGICESLFNGLCKPWNSYMEIDSWLTSNLTQYEYNPTKAKELLAAAQKDGKWDPNQELKLVYYYSDTQSKDLMAAIKQQLAQVGVKISVNFMEGTAAVAAMKACQFDLYYQGWGFTHPLEYVPTFVDSPRCQGWWDDAAARELFKKASVTVDEKERRNILDQTQKKLNDELPILPFAKYQVEVALNKRVQGFDADALWFYFVNPWSAGYHNAWNWNVTG